jgi:hypothetical protein
LLFAFLATIVGVLTSVNNSFVGNLKKAISGHSKTLGEFEDFFVSLAADSTGFCTWHIF